MNSSSLTKSCSRSNTSRRNKYNNNNNKRPLLSLYACLGLVALHQQVVVEAFTPALVSPLFVNRSARTKGGASPARRNAFHGTTSKSSTVVAASATAAAASSNTNNNMEGGEPLYVPASLYAAESNDQRYSASDWFHNMKTLPRSSILKEIKGPVLTIALWSSAISMIHKLLLHKNMVGAAQAMCMSSKPHSFLVSALGLLLVFRTNTAYQRFAEGRQIWEKILSVSRNMSRMASLYEHEIGPECKKRVFRLLSAFPYLLRHHIQPQCLDCDKIQSSPYAILLTENGTEKGRASALLRNNRRANVKTNGDDTVNMMQKAAAHNNHGDCWVDRRRLPWCLLPDAALSKCAVSDNRPLWICDRLSQELTSVAYTPNFTSRERLTFLGYVDKLSQCIGECERIHQTAVPLNYARHSLRSLTLWLFSLPFCLVGELSLLTGPVMGAIAWVLLGVYQIGYSIEDPFQGSLRLSILCDAVYRDVMYVGRMHQENPRDSAYELTEEADEWEAMDNTTTTPTTTILPSSLVGAAP